MCRYCDARRNNQEKFKERAKLGFVRMQRVGKSRHEHSGACALSLGYFPGRPRLPISNPSGRCTMSLRPCASPRGSSPHFWGDVPERRTPGSRIGPRRLLSWPLPWEPPSARSSSSASANGVSKQDDARLRRNFIRHGALWFALTLPPLVLDISEGERGDLADGGDELGDPPRTMLRMRPERPPPPLLLLFVALAASAYLCCSCMYHSSGRDGSNGFSSICSSPIVICDSRPRRQPLVSKASASGNTFGAATSSSSSPGASRMVGCAMASARGEGCAAEFGVDAADDPDDAEVEEDRA